MLGAGALNLKGINNRKEFLVVHTLLTTDFSLEEQPLVQ